LNQEIIRKIEETFRSAHSSNELFDAFQTAINLKVSDLSIYKILIANPALSVDEINMFTKKLINEIPGKKYELLLWTGKVFENHPQNIFNIENTFSIYQQAIFQRPNSHEPLLRLLNLYNHDLKLPTNQKIINLIEKSLAAVDKKSKVYSALAKHYKKCGDSESEKRYLRLAETSAKLERG